MSNEETPKKVKQIYNDHLSISRSFRRKPFRIRKDFKNFKEKDTRYKYYAKLSNWFEKHPEINCRLYFEATLFFHKDEDIVHIKEYCKSKALSNYTQYVKIIKTLNLDNPKSLKMCVDGFNFISEFCEKENIHPREYLTHKPSDKSNYSFLKHIKNMEVNVYLLFSFNSFYSQLKEIYRDIELWNFYLEDLSPTVMLNRYEGSEKFKSLSEQALQKIIKKIVA